VKYNKKEQGKRKRKKICWCRTELYSLHYMRITNSKSGVCPTCGDCGFIFDGMEPLAEVGSSVIQ